MESQLKVKTWIFNPGSTIHDIQEAQMSQERYRRLVEGNWDYDDKGEVIDSPRSLSKDEVKRRLKP